MKKEKCLANWNNAQYCILEKGHKGDHKCKCCGSNWFINKNGELCYSHFYNKEITPPICACGREMKPVYDSIAKKVTGYQWSCECSPGLTLSIG